MFPSNFQYSPFSILALLLINTICNAQEVDIPQGALRGGSRTNIDGGSYYVFKRIPYGKPPIGELRFKVSDLADGWDGVRDATQEVPQCPQQHTTTIDGQEDCLYLNIYTPGLPSENVTGKPVMVYMHGGGSSQTSATESEFGAEYLLTKDVVLVVINYRLGIFGFLTVDDPTLGVTGNVGLKDQSLALTWLNNNIEYFGGDPNNILIFGESGGGISSHFHMLSPMSRGLFHKVISQSGTATTPDAFGNTRNTGILLAQELGIQTENLEAMLLSMQALPMEEVYAASRTISAGNRDMIHPIVEVASTAPVFLSRTPIELLDEGDFYDVPQMIGFNNAEGIILLDGSADETGSTRPMDDLSRYIPPDLEIEPGSEAAQDIIQRLIDFYYAEVETARENVTADITLFTDFICAYPMYRATSSQIKSSQNPIYFYYFSADTKLNYKSLQPAMAAQSGAGHFDELGYLFTRSILPLAELGSIEEVGMRNMVELWTNFATYGNPTPEGFNYIWQPLQEDQFNYFHITTEGYYPGVDLLPENLQLWAGIYEDYFPRKRYS